MEIEHNHPLTRYVAGFLFDDLKHNVALIWKNKPEWQSGKLNGIGGKVEHGETADAAMYREFLEEAGVEVTEWNHFADVSWDSGVVHFYRAFVPHQRLLRCEAQEDEKIEIFPTQLHLIPTARIPNLNWLLPLALYTHDEYHLIQAREK